MNSKMIFFILLSCFLHQGCYRVGPNHSTPEIELPEKWEGACGNDDDASDATNNIFVSDWWKAFHDSQLDLLMDWGLRNNPDIHIAYHRINEYRALYFESRADQFPMLYMGAGHANVELPAQGILFQQSSLTNFLNAQNVKLQRHIDFFHMGPTASWEIDIFGRIESENLARASELDASQDHFRAIQISLTAEIATNYIHLRSIQNQYSVEEAYLQALLTREGVLNERLAINKATLDNLSDVKVKIYESRRTLLRLNKFMEQYKHRLLTLIGETIWPFDDSILLCYSAIPQPCVNINPGIPSHLLQQRPDVHQADKELAAATYRVGRTMAEALPNFVLVGTIGGISKQLANILSFKSLYWLYEPFFSFPIFDAGRNKATLTAYKARANAAFSHYHKTLLIAVEEVQVALYALNSDEGRLEQDKLIYSNSQDSLERKAFLFEKAMTDYISLNLGEDQFYERKLELLQSQEEYALSFVNLSKALGGKIQ